MSIETRTRHDSRGREVKSYRVKWRLNGNGPWQSRTVHLKRDARDLDEALRDAGFRYESDHPAVVTLSLIGADTQEADTHLGGPTLADAARTWATRPGLSPGTLYLYTRAVDALGDLGQRPVRSVTHEEVNAYLRRRYHDESPSQAKRSRQVIVAALRAHDRDTVANKAETYTTDRELDPVYLTPAQVDTLVAAAHEVAPADYALALELAVRNGLRWGELFALTPRHLSADGRSVRVRQSVKRSDTARAGFTPTKTKNRKERTVPVPVGLRPHLVELASGVNPSSPLFKPPTIGFWTSDRSDTVWHNVRAKAVELDPSFPGHMRFHDLRHTAAKAMLTAGVRIEVVSKILGHASVGFTAKQYWEVDETDLDHALALMAG